METKLGVVISYWERQLNSAWLMNVSDRNMVEATLVYLKELKK